MTDHLDRAAEVIAAALRSIWEADVSWNPEARDIARALEEAGLLVTPEHEHMERRFAEFLCEVTDGMLSKTGYDVRTMVQATDDCYERYRDRNDAEVAAGSLREAADEINDPTRTPGIESAAHAVVYLYDRADRIEGER